MWGEKGELGAKCAVILGMQFGFVLTHGCEEVEFFLWQLGRLIEGKFGDATIGR